MYIFSRVICTNNVQGKDKKIAEDALSKFEESSRGLVDNITSDAMKSILSSGSNPMEEAAAIENNDTSEE